MMGSLGRIVGRPDTVLLSSLDIFFELSAVPGDANMWICVKEDVLASNTHSPSTSPFHVLQYPIFIVPTNNVDFVFRIFLIVHPHYSTYWNGPDFSSSFISPYISQRQSIQGHIKDMWFRVNDEGPPIKVLFTNLEPWLPGHGHQLFLLTLSPSLGFMSKAYPLLLMEMAIICMWDFDSSGNFSLFTTYYTFRNFP